MTNVIQKIDPNSRVAPFYSYSNVTTAVSAPIKTSGGFLHSITFNKPVATGTVIIADVTSAFATTIIGTITVPASPQPVTLFYDIEFASGLSLVVGTAAQDITVSYL